MTDNAGMMVAYFRASRVARYDLAMAPPTLPALPPAQSTAPDPSLRVHVSRYVQLELDVPRGETMRHQLSALTGSVVAVVWSGEVTMGGGGAFGAGAGEATVDGVSADGVDFDSARPERWRAPGRIMSCCMIGPLTRWHDNILEGSLRSFCVHFTPLGANTLLQLRGCGLSDRSVALAELLEHRVALEARAWADEVMHARSFAERVAATDRFLLRRLRRAAAPVELVAAAVARLAIPNGRSDRVSALVADLGCSERTLRRRFREELGLSVKTFARITRFRGAHAFLQGSRRADWADAVARFGYVDQAHLIHDYRELAGTTPARFSAGERFLDSALTPGAAR
jgi:AraC-like DNA-binding protein